MSVVKLLFHPQISIDNRRGAFVTWIFQNHKYLVTCGLVIGAALELMGEDTFLNG